MEVYKVGKVIENQKINVHLALQQLEAARGELKKSLSRRREIAIQQNDSQYQEEDTTELFDNGNSIESDKAIKEILEKNNILSDDIINLKREQEIQFVRLCEVVEQKKKAKEDKTMAEEDKRQISMRLDERTTDMQRLTNNQLDMVNQLLLVNQELGRKDMEINNLRSENDQLRNELRSIKEINKRMKKPNEAAKYVEELLRSPRRSSDRSGLGLNEHSSSIEEGESSKSGEKKNAKPKNNKPTCHHCGKPGHTTNICRSKHGKSDLKPKFNGHFFNCKKHGHQTQECRSKVNSPPILPKFQGHYLNCQKYGHRAFECRSKPKWSSNE